MPAAAAAAGCSCVPRRPGRPAAAPPPGCCGAGCALATPAGPSTRGGGGPASSFAPPGPPAGAGFPSSANSGSVCVSASGAPCPPTCPASRSPTCVAAAAARAAPAAAAASSAARHSDSCLACRGIAGRDVEGLGSLKPAGAVLVLPTAVGGPYSPAACLLAACEDHPEGLLQTPGRSPLNRSRERRCSRLQALLAAPQTRPGAQEGRSQEGRSGGSPWGWDRHGRRARQRQRRRADRTQGGVVTAAACYIHLWAKRHASNQPCRSALQAACVP